MMDAPPLAVDKRLKLSIRLSSAGYYDVYVKRGSTNQTHFLSIGSGAELLDDDAVIASGVKSWVKGDHAASVRWIISTIRDHQLTSVKK